MSKTVNDQPTLFAHLKSFCQLPALATIVVPLLIIAGGAGTEIYIGHHFYLGVIFLMVGVVLFIWTNHLFHIRGKGTLAPWNPTRVFVAEGIYRYVRNPMISAVFLVLIGEAFILRCVAIFLWALIFILLNFVYIPTWEEPGLVERFGEEYERYLCQVPPWFPRLSPYGKTNTEKFRLLKGLRSCGFTLFVLIALLHLFGALFQQYCLHRDAEIFPPAGRLYDVGGHKLHAHIQGSGGPIVVFDAGMGSTSLDWGLIQKHVSKRTTTLVYDRAGLGWSEAGPSPRNSIAIAQELKKLLDVSKLSGPYVLVGHSYGSYNVRTFQRLFPKLVCGIVLVDGSLELAPEISDPHSSKVFRFFEAMAHFGFVRAALTIHQPKITSQHYRLGLERMAAWRACYARPDAHRAFALESLAFRESGAFLAKGKRDLGDLPLAVVSASPPGIKPEIMKLKSAQANLSSAGRHFVSTGSGHYVQLEDPDLVKRAIDYVLDTTNLGVHTKDVYH